MKKIIQVFVSYYFMALFLIPFREMSVHYFRQITWFVFLYACLVMIVLRFAHVISWKFVKKNTLIIGTGPVAQQVYYVCRGNRFSLMDIKGFISCDDDYFHGNYEEDTADLEKPFFSIRNLESVIERYHINTVLIALPQMGHHDLVKLNNRLIHQVETIKYLPFTDSLVTFDSTIDDFDGLLMISTSKARGTLPSKILKRLMDIGIGSIGCLMLIPLTLYVRHINHKNGDYGPLFFSQKRIGLDGKEFTILKFRTMVEGADQILEDLMASDPQIRAEYQINKKLVNDPRITPAGEFLRRTSLDEFPQFLQVLSGKMSVIGPRPYLPREKRDMKEYYYDIIQVKPGVSGMWQTHGRSNTTFEERLELDAYYYRNWNLWLDMVLLVKTIKPIIAGKENGAR
jgi:undecaprenyl-phosphate galactose phosphotransferase